MTSSTFNIIHIRQQHLFHIFQIDDFHPSKKASLVKITSYWPSSYSNGTGICKWVVQKNDMNLNKPQTKFMEIKFSPP